ncbi:hypothetical protein I4F81_007155 [Pyropia yezoensis]|uniref:Uncharacterized protein n=1 Tax=Pyropia yezoensis TaxID=2788 RepID=A0ACC3C3B9_PYRYE|nr:hypothetical protein I4F81_007155 [Neopyropia yezoensis]
MAGVGGNVVTASPISDLNPVWMAAVSADTDGCADLWVSVTTRRVAATAFFTGYRRTALRPGEVLAAILVPWTAPGEHMHAFKASRRREDDIAIVSAGIRLRLQWRPPPSPPPPSPAGANHPTIGGWRIADAALAYGGMAATSVTTPRTAAVLVGAPWAPSTLAAALDVLAAEVALPPGVPGGMAPYRVGVALSFLAQAWTRTALAVRGTDGDGASALWAPPRAEWSGAWDAADEEEAREQGELEVGGGGADGLAGSLGMAPTGGAAASTAAVTDAAVEALERPVANGGAPPTADGAVADQSVGTAAKTPGASSAGGAVKGPGPLPVDAWENGGDPQPGAWENGPVLPLNGNVGVGPRPPISSDISPPSRTRVTHTTPHGGTFRGTQVFSATPPAAAVHVGKAAPHAAAAAHVTGTAAYVDDLPLPARGLHGALVLSGRPHAELRGLDTTAALALPGVVRVVTAADVPGSNAYGVTHVTDEVVFAESVVTGTRHAFLAEYKVAYVSAGAAAGGTAAGTSGDDDGDAALRGDATGGAPFHPPVGRLVALSIDLYSNAGHTADLSIPVMDRALFHLDNAYNIPATPYGMAFDPSSLRACWHTVLSDAGWSRRRAAVDAFNAAHRYRKRGLAAVPSKFGIAFTFVTYNQAAALLHVSHADGSVLLATGGVEMGQGLHTKLAAVAATELGLPPSAVHVEETATYARRINLSAYGFYRTPRLDAVDLGAPSPARRRGSPFFYWTTGAAVAEVELSTLTGGWSARRVDIAMDAGRSLNPALDVGQIEGAFVQGMGWCTMEELIPAARDIPRDFRVRVLDRRCEADTIHSSKAIGEPPLFLAASVFFALKDAVYAARAHASTADPSPHPPPADAPADTPATDTPATTAAAAAAATPATDTPASRSQPAVPHVRLDCPASVERLRVACPDEYMGRAGRGGGGEAGGEGVPAPDIAL